MARKFLTSAYITLSPCTRMHTQAPYTKINLGDTMLLPSSRTLLQVFSLDSSDLRVSSTRDMNGREETKNAGQSEIFPAYAWPECHYA